MRLLLICPCFNNYEVELKNACLNLDYDVDVIFYHEKNYLKYNGLGKIISPILNILKIIIGFNNQLLFKINYALNRCIKTDSLDNYILTEANKGFVKNKKKYNKTLIVKGFGLSKDTICSLKLITESGGLILYQWDSIIRFPILVQNYPLFDKIFTFQKKDIEFFPKSIFLPSFCALQRLPNSKGFDSSYEVVFVGGFSITRLRILLDLKRKFTKKKLSYFFYLKWPLREFKLNKCFILTNKPLNLYKCWALYENSKCIIDIVHKGQSGLTTRIQEAFFLNKNLLTNKEYFLNSGIPVDKDIFFIESFKSSKNYNLELNTSVEIDRKNYLRPINEWLKIVLS